MHCTATVIVPIRVGHKAFLCYLDNLTYCLKSLQAQTASFEFLVVDYGSGDPYALKIQKLANKFGATYIRGEGPVWSRSRALNVGIRRATKDCVLFIDADCVVPKKYVERHMSMYIPKRFTYSSVYDTNKDVVKSAYIKDLVKYSTGIRSQGFSHMGVSTLWLKRNKGFNEKYIGWGGEDNDLWLRLRRSGIKPQEVKVHPYHLWHAYYGDIMASIGKRAAFKQMRQANRNRYFNLRDKK